MGVSTDMACVWNRDRLLKLLETLSREYDVNLNEFVINVVSKSKDDISQFFEALVSIILSQNTSDRNAIKAFNNLKSLLGLITPEKIIQLDSEELKKAISVAGLANKKTEVIKRLASVFISNSEFFKKLNSLSTEEIRSKLLELPGVGLKTADVFLLMVLRKPTFPIDTHINRVMRRLGIALTRDRYEDMRAKVLNYIGSDVEKLSQLHFLLIIHGRKVCKARKPLCTQCAISSMCCKVV